MKKLLLTISALFIALFSVGQLAQGVLQMGGGNDQGNCIIQTMDGGYAIAGYTSAYTVSNKDVRIIKLDLNGNIVWARTIGGAGVDSAASIIETTDGGYMICGSTNSYGGGGYDIYLIRIDSLANIKWTETLGGAGNDYGRSMVQSTDGNFVIAGATNSYGFGGYDAYVVKVDTVGNILWAKTIGGSGNDYANSISKTMGGGYAITGYTNSYGAGGNDVYVVKLAPTGNAVWSRTIGGAGNDQGNSIIQKRDGSYSVTGTTTSYGLAGGVNLYYISLDSTSNLKKGISIGGGWEAGNSIIQSHDGGICIAGYTYSYETDGTGGAYVLKFDTANNLKNALTVGPVCTANANSVIQTKDGGYATVGSNCGPPGSIYMLKFDSSLNICYKEIKGDSIFLGGVSSSGGVIGSGGIITSRDSGRIGSGSTFTDVCRLYTSVNNIPELPTQIEISPNPSNGIFVLEEQGVRNKEQVVEVYNMLGEKIYQHPFSALHTSLDLSAQPSGIYLYRVIDEDGKLIGSGKLLIEK